MKAILVNHNYTPDWFMDYDFEYLIYDRSDDESYIRNALFPGKYVIRKTENVGNVDHDKLSYLIDNYYNLPEVFLWGKSNLFKYVTQEEFDEILSKPLDFTPLLSKGHKIYSDYRGKVNYYEQQMYWERNDSWYLSEHPAKFNSWEAWANYLQLPTMPYLPFPPGGNFILTRERVHRYARDFYIKMRDTLPYTQLPGEAQLCERTYFLLWQ